jgi:hypothetical protein
MRIFPNSPRLIKVGGVTMDPHTSALQSVITLQYNPNSLTSGFHGLLPVPKIP